MRKIILWAITVLLLMACAINPKAIKTKHIIYTNTYVDPINDYYVNYYKQIRKFELIFINDTICVFRNTFFCRDIPKNYKIIDQVCRYMHQDSLLIVNDLSEQNSECFFIDIPILNSKHCPFFSELGHQVLMGGGGSLYNLYGKIPNITNDTLYFKGNNKNILVLHKKKKDKSDSIYCEFEKQ